VRVADNPGRKDCIDDIAKRSGRSRRDVEAAMDAVDERAQAYTDDGMDAEDAYARARDEEVQNLNERSAIERRARILDARKGTRRSRFYNGVADAIGRLPAGGWIARRFGMTREQLQAKAAKIALEAKLVGVNLPLVGNRKSVDAQFVALRRLWVGGLAKDLDDAGLLKAFATRALEDKWTDELFELNKRPSAAWQDAKDSGDTRTADELGWKGQGPGNPGITKDAQALEIAKIVQKWQRTSIAALNREGAWVRSYSGYITRTSHDADRIRGPKGTGQEQWVADTLPRLDLARTFGSTDLQRARDALRAMWRPMADGEHYDFGRGEIDPVHPNPARTASAERELHFRSGADWRAYNEKYGTHDATRTVVDALVRGARRTALMKEFGTRPSEAFESDIDMIKGRLQGAADARIAKLSALEQAAASAGADATAKAAIEKQMEALRRDIAARAGDLEEFSKFVGKDRFWGSPAHNRFAQIDGTSMKPINRTASDIAAKWMAIQRMAKLGRVAFTHFASLPLKAQEAAYWGIPFAERYGSLFRGLTQGAEGSAKREALDAMLAGLESRLGHMMLPYDVADAPAGFLARWESTFFRLTGVSSVIDNQRGDAEVMFATHIGKKRGQAWADIGASEQRVLAGFGIGEAEWKALHGVEWSSFGDRVALTPQDAMKLSDDQVRAYIKEARPAELAPTSAEDVATAREDLALALATAYSDRAGYAIPMPSARTRAIMFQGAFQPGTGLNIALRLIYQFKLWPAEMIMRAWGREIAGRIGDPTGGRIAGLLQFLAGSIVFGTAAEAVREAIQGRDPLHELATKPAATLMRGLERSGFGSLLGDYLLGEYDRHGLLAAAQLAGPTISQIDTLMGLLHGNGDGLLNAIAGIDAGKQAAHPWRERASAAIKLLKDNTPYQSLWFSSWATDALVWHTLQDWVNPGYLDRAQRRAERIQGTQYIHLGPYGMGPADVHRAMTGQR
jgi:hypothetical protein